MTTAKNYLTAQVLVTLLVLTKTTIAQEHTIIALSHSDHTVYEVDAASGKILNQFKAEHEPHEGVVSRDGKTVYVSLPEAGYVVVLDATDWAPSPESLYSAIELRKILRNSLRKLRPALRVVFVLRDMEGQSITQTSGILNLTTNAVKTRLSRARLQLREELTLYFKQQNT